MCPRKDAQTQVDSRGIECIGRLLQLHRKAVAGVKFSGDLNEAYRKIRVDAAVSLFVGIGQRALGNITSYAQVIELRLMGAQASFDVAKTLAVSQLGKRHTEKLIEM